MIERKKQREKKIKNHTRIQHTEIFGVGHLDMNQIITTSKERILNSL